MKLESPVHIDDLPQDDLAQALLTTDDVATILGKSEKSVIDAAGRALKGHAPYWYVEPISATPAGRGFVRYWTKEAAEEMLARISAKAKEKAPTSDVGATEIDSQTLTVSADISTGDAVSQSTGHDCSSLPLFSLFSSVQSTTPEKPITYADLVAASTAPQKTEKHNAACFIPSNARAKTKEAISDTTRFALSVIDIDTDTPLDDVENGLLEMGIGRALIYSTKSAKDQCKKWRVVVPFADYVDIGTWQALTALLCERFGGDTAMIRSTQVSFVPNIGEHYQCHEINQSSPLDVNHPAIVRAIERQQERQIEQEAIERAKAKEKARTQPPSLANGQSPIDAFNRQTKITTLLEQHGYKRMGKKYQCPNSTSGMAGVVILQDETGKERAYSHHSPQSDDLATGMAHDAFSVFCVLGHGGNQDAAIKDAGDITGITQANRDAYRERLRQQHLERERQQTAAIDGGVQQDVSQAGGQGRVTWADLIKGDAYWPENYTKRKDGIVTPATTANALFALRLEGLTGYVDKMAAHELFVHGVPDGETLDCKLNDAAQKAQAAGIKGMTPAILMMAARAAWPQVHPLYDLISGATWDGHDRISDLADCLTFEAPIYQSVAKEYLTAWLTDGVLGWGSDGTVMDRMLVLSGGQGIGKTEFFRQIVPAEMAHAVKSGVMLDLRDKDSIKRAVSAAITELGELDGTFRKSDIAALKAFLSNKDDFLRPPYEKRDIKIPRRTLFCGSVNDHAFLVDEENRRFFVLSVTAINHTKYNEIDKLQLWAQALAMAKESGRVTVDKGTQREINTLHSSYLDDPLIQKIDDMITWPTYDEMQNDPPEFKWVSIATLIEEAGGNVAIAKGGVVSKIGQYLKATRKAQHKRTSAGTRYYLPVARNSPHH